MISLLAAHIIITGTCLWVGYIFNDWFLKNKAIKPLLLHAITGLIVLTMISQIVVLFIPVNFYFTLILFLLLGLTALLKRKSFIQFARLILNEISSLPLYAKSLLALLWLMILVINAGPVIMDDTESYHIQAIKWIQEQGSVPGIANLHERYGFNSSWFSSIALFNFPQGNLFSGLNGTLSLWFSYYIIIASFSLTNEKNNSSPAWPLLFVLALSL